MAHCTNMTETPVSQAVYEAALWVCNQTYRPQEMVSVVMMAGMVHNLSWEDTKLVFQYVEEEGCSRVGPHMMWPTRWTD